MALDGIDLVRQVGEQGRLIARAGANLEHPVGRLHIDGRGHAADKMRARDGDAIADVEKGVIVGSRPVAIEDKLLAWGQ